VKPILREPRTVFQQLTVAVFLVVPTLALVAAIPWVWGWGLGWTDVAIGAAFYVVGCLGVTVGFHRCFTHRSFKPSRPLRVALAVAGSLAVEGSLVDWVAAHRRHHAYSDKEGDPHSPWLYGTSTYAVAKGFWHAYMGWMLGRDSTNRARFAPDLLADPDLARVHRLFPLWTVLSFLVPPLLGGVITMSWWGALTAFFWAGLVRIALLHHVTWSVNSVCHMVGERPFASRDQSTNVWVLAIPSMGESWHNFHHADPTCARHGVLRGQLDVSARTIWVFERLGWVRDVRWPVADRVARLTLADGPPPRS
jgi:stearoyl-CoA desaturase (delta-9 desaturase)